MRTKRDLENKTNSITISHKRNYNSFISSTENNSVVFVCDTIELKGGFKLYGHIIEINSNTIKYKDCDDQSSSVKVIDKTRVSVVAFAGGTRQAIAKSSRKKYSSYSSTPSSYTTISSTPSSNYSSGYGTINYPSVETVTPNPSADTTISSPSSTSTYSSSPSYSSSSPSTTQSSDYSSSSSPNNVTTSDGEKVLKGFLKAVWFVVKIILIITMLAFLSTI